MKTKTERVAALMACEHNPLKDQKALEAASEAALLNLEAHCTKATEDAKKAAELKAAEDKKAADEKAAADKKAAEEAALKAAEAGKPKPKTEAEWLEEAPPALRTLVADAKAREESRKGILVEKLKTAQTAYTEAELKVMEVKQLEKIALLANVDEPVDFSGRGVPRTTPPSEGDYLNQPPPDGYRIALDKRSGQKEKVN